MVRFNGIDTSARTVTLTFDYNIEDDESVLQLAKERLGEDLPIHFFEDYLNDLKEWIKNE